MIRLTLRLLDALLAPAVLAAAALLRWVRRRDLSRMPVSRSLFRMLGVVPVVDHYYEPFYNPRDGSVDRRRDLAGVDLDVPRQLRILERFRYGAELERFPSDRPEGRAFYFQNGYFGPGDAEYLYSVVRHFKPARIIEVGAGYSTLIAQEALRRNREEDARRPCEHICIEPFENPWLGDLDVEVVKQPVETLAPSFFSALGANDILFIDSSHVVRPHGDVLYEYLELLPKLGSGVLVHVHDVFTPADYPDAWLLEKVLFWNEQYLLEAFLSCNDRFEVIGALNYLAHHHPQELGAACPVFGRMRRQCEPGSFWLRRK